MELACAPDMVCAVHDLKAYFRGPELHVSFHLEIDRHESLDRVHDLEQRLRLELLDIPEIDDISVHLDPIERPPGDGGKPAPVGGKATPPSLSKESGV
jgi:divalent metal cation (Fe/Co/Zn/Cd) transporter